MVMKKEKIEFKKILDLQKEDVAVLTTNEKINVKGGGKPQDIWGTGLSCNCSDGTACWCR